jgi:sodium/hydrogen exchanger 8
MGVCDDGKGGDGKCYCKSKGLDPYRFCREETYDKNSEVNQEKQQEMGFIVMLVVAFLCSMLLYLYDSIHELHMFPESIAAIIIGIGIGMFFKVVHGQNGMVNFLEFEPHTFFLILLPPIMFQAGFSMHMPSFLRNFRTINMYAIFATFIASFVFGVLFYYGSKLTEFEFAFLDSLHFG